ncbi:MAG: AAA family ATPase, partial [Nitrospirae bacterium]|nr:AAA family ATPase [Nitrospirota bacterium]
MTTKLFLSPKITPPKLRGISPRKRLFNLIHHASDQKIFWITSPPGSGKTTLAASYSETLKIPIFWYQLDSGDADLGSFFHYLSQAVSLFSPRQKRAFPPFTPDYLMKPGLFSRIFFREMVQR